MTNDDRPEFYSRIDDALKVRNQLATALEAIASEITPREFPAELTHLVSLLRSSAQAEQFVHDGVSAAWLPLILQSNPSDHVTSVSQIVSEVTFAEEARQSRWRNAAYPLFILAIAIVIFILLTVFVVPTFRKMFFEFELRLPAATTLLFRVADLINGSPVYFCLSLLGVGLVCLGLRKLFALLYPYLEASTVLGFLVGGNTNAVRAMGRFASTLAELICIGAPLDQAILISGRASQNHRIKIASDQMSVDIRATGKFQPNLTVSHNFPDLVRHALQAGPNGAPSIPLLRQISAIYLERVRHRFDWAAGLFPPLAICGVGLVVGFIVIALFLPLISLITSLS